MSGGPGPLEVEDLSNVVALERSLLDPTRRADREYLRGHLHAEFVEYGASGRIWDRDSIIEELAGNPAAAGVATDFVATRLSNSVVLVTYRVDGEASSLRSSIWVRDADTWSLRFHQGTPTRSPA